MRGKKRIVGGEGRGGRGKWEKLIGLNNQENGFSYFIHVVAISI